MAGVTEEDLRRAAALLRAGGLVAFPTETVYGLGANAMDTAAVSRIFEAKGRPRTSPLIVHVPSAAIARDVVVAHWPAKAEILAARYWPGPLTMLLRKRPEVPDIVTAGLPTVGVRVPAHPVALRLITEAGMPVAAPSANRFTELSPVTAAHVREGLGSSVDLVLDGGPSVVGIESTVLSLASEPPVLLRPGIVTRTEIEALIGPVDLARAVGAGAHSSPGQHRQHYRPRTPLRVAGNPASRSVWLYIREPDSRAGSQLRMPDDPREYARMLYSTLHDLDHQGWDEIVVEPLSEAPEWAGIRDRLWRASR